MGALLNTIGKSVGAVGNIIVILGIIVYMFAVVGMQMFRNTYTADKFDKPSRWNFEDFGHSFMVIFRILCGKWIEPLWDTMKATGASAVLFVLPAFVIGNFVILNLFLALLLNSFGGDLGSDEEKEETEEERKKKEEEEAEKERKKKEKKDKRFARLSRLMGRKSISGSRSKVGPDDEEVNENSEMLPPEDGDENDNKTETANNLDKSRSNDSINNENGIEMKEINQADREGIQYDLMHYLKTITRIPGEFFSHSN